MKNNEIRRGVYTPGLQIRRREDGSESRTITGYAIRFNSESAPLSVWNQYEDREVIAPGAITRELLDGSDILMTLFHDRGLILARSKEGKGTLSYNVDAKGVSFEFDAPNTADGDKALELVRRGDIDGCSFAFTTNYGDPDCVTASAETRDGRIVTTYTVNRVTGVYDFTLTPDPAYPATSCEARDLFAALHGGPEPEPRPERKAENRAQVDELRSTAAKSIFVQL